MPDSDRAHVSAAEFGELFRSLSTWGRWGELDERGALNYITVDRVAEAARLVSRGITVSLSWPLDTDAAAHNPSPAEHRMTSMAERTSAAERCNWPRTGSASTTTATRTRTSTRSATSRTQARSTTERHRTSSRRSAPRRRRWKPPRTVSSAAACCSTSPRARRAMARAGGAVFRDDLEAAELEQGVRVAEGDILLVRTGHAGRLEEIGTWDTANAKAGLHPTAMPFLAERRVAALGSDGNSDTAPGSTDGVDFPIHVLAINAMGIHLLDYLQLEELAGACERERRWTFFLVAAPLRIAGGTGSPLNPIAIL